MSALPQRGDASPPSIDLSKKKVLIIEDFFSFRLTVKNMLRSYQITDIDEASTGDEAVRKIASKRYDIILCDYNLGPGRDGQQILEEAKHREYIHYSTIFMMITAENTMDMFMGALEYQPDDYLMKPFTKEALEKKLRDLIRKKENLREIEKEVANKAYGAAIGLCDVLISRNVKNLSEVLKLKGEFLMINENYREAEFFYEKVLTMGNLPWALLGLGRVKFLKGLYEEAKNIFEELVVKHKRMMAAHDWLAKTKEKMGLLQEAQQILMAAVQISPKAILRQKALGSIAYRNKDLAIAEQAMKETIKQGKHSFFKSPNDYVALSKVLVETGSPEQGIAVLADAGREFPDTPEVSLQVAAAECFVYHHMKRSQDARAAAGRAAQAATTFEGKLPAFLVVDLAKAMFMAGHKDRGSEIIRGLVQSNHEDQDILGSVQDMFKDLGMEQEGVRIVSIAREEILKLNNQGVGLVREGNLEKAIEYFERAALTLPENKIIAANAAHALILYMKKFGRQDPYLDRARTYLQRVRELDPSYRDLSRLLDLYQELAGKA